MDDSKQEILGAEVSIEKEMKQSYLDYAMSVIVGRALPDVRDGLKPVHRRVLFGMHELGNDWNKPFKKSARIVGDVMGKYHPHGDSAIYDTLVRMAQDFSLRYCLVDGQGNFGSIDGDSAAAMRYTEARMSKIAHELLADLDKETVDFIPNYDESEQEPSVMPARIPTLLINGSSGIAVGMATNIPPHNLGEVVDALTAMISQPGITDDELLGIIKGPDFPTGGIIYGHKGIEDAYRTGRGTLHIRARLFVETDKKTGAETIVVNELPYQVNKAKLVEKIDELVREKVIEGIRFVRDESDMDGMRIAIGLKRDQISDVIINQLFKHTRMATSFGIIFLAVANGKPELLTLRQILQYFILHRKEVVIRRTTFELKKAEARAHILEGLLMALDNIDEIVTRIRASATPAEARASLMAMEFTKFDNALTRDVAGSANGSRSLTEIQAQAILDMRLQRLTGLERDKLSEEYQGLVKDIGWYRDVLGSERLVLGIIREELEAIKKEFADERRTEITGVAKEISIEDLIVEEDMVVTISKRGYIKRNAISMYQNQRRGGKGKTAMSTREDDFVSQMFVASTHHTFMFFTNLGRVYWCKVYDIPQASRTSLGKAIVNLLNLTPEEKLSTVLSVPQFEPGCNVILATRGGIVKKTSLMEYSHIRKGGILAINLSPGDELIHAAITDGSMHIVLSSANGKAIRFHESDVRAQGRVTAGVKGMTLEDGDMVVGMETLCEDNTLLTSITENGYGKRTSLAEYPLQKRGGKGVITIKTDERNGKVVSVLAVGDDEELMLLTATGKLIRISASSISVIGRNTKGVTLMSMDDDETVVSVAMLAEREDDGNGAAIQESLPEANIEMTETDNEDAE